jgi:type VI secretion system secreted protein VgrG
MVLIRKSQEADFIFQAAGYDGDLRVIQFQGSEGVSELFRFRIELASLDPAIDFDAVVGKAGLLRIYYPDGQRYINGRVLAFDHVREGTEYTYYECLLVPVIRFLKYRHDCRIFQKMDVREIVERVLSDAGVPGDQYRFALQKNYETREYCVQYQESDFNFISRLLEEEGICYFFEHSDQNHVMVMADSPVAHVPIKGTSKLPFREKIGLLQAEESITDWRFGQKVRTGSVVLRDFSFKQPRMDLETNEMAGSDTGLEVYDYPGMYEEQGRGKRLAKVRLESFQSSRKIGRGESSCRRMPAGYRFTLSQHPRNDFNQEYLIINTEHEGRQPQAAGHEVETRDEEAVYYRNRFTCIPADCTFHPRAKTPRPKVYGTQTAIVVGPGGEEIYTDEHGRIKVQFHWDREGRMDENSSCWIRVNQNWAGGRYGMMTLPRIGQEVVVDFLEGDPDRPLVTGQVYNGDLKHPYTLPDDKTKSTIKTNTSKGGGGFNEIRFEDLSGKEQIFMHAQKDQDIHVVNDRREWIGQNRSLIVKKDKMELVEKNAHTTVLENHISQVKGDVSRSIKGDRLTKIDGDDHLSVAGNQIQKFDADRSTKIGMNLNESVGMSHAEEAGMNITLKAGMNVVIEAGLNLTIKGPGGFININPAGIFINGNLVLINSGGAPGVAAPVIMTQPKPPEYPQEPDEADDGQAGKDETFKKAPTRPQTEPYEPFAFKEPAWPMDMPLTQAAAMNDAARIGAPFVGKCPGT